MVAKNLLWGEIMPPLLPGESLHGI